MTKKTPDKILFLDIDGVLNTTRSTIVYGAPHMGVLTPWKHLDSVGCDFIRRLNQIFNVGIVVTSSWRIGASVDELSQKLSIPIHDRIMVDCETRADEIATWLLVHTQFDEPGKFVILDDEDDGLSERYGDMFILVSDSDGISNSNMQSTTKALNINLLDMVKITANLPVSIPDNSDYLHVIERKKTKFRITRSHYTDLQCAAENGGADGKAIWDRLHKNYEFEIDEVSVEGRFYMDMSVCFMYPNGAAASQMK